MKRQSVFLPTKGSPPSSGAVKERVSECSPPHYSLACSFRMPRCGRCDHVVRSSADFVVISVWGLRVCSACFAEQNLAKDRPTPKG